MYASVLAYKPLAERHRLQNYVIPMEKIILFQNQGKIPENAVTTLTVFTKANEVD